MALHASQELIAAAVCANGLFSDKALPLSRDGGESRASRFRICDASGRRDVSLCGGKWAASQLSRVSSAWWAVCAKALFSSGASMSGPVTSELDKDDPHRMAAVESSVRSRHGRFFIGPEDSGNESGTSVSLTRISLAVVIMSAPM